MSIVASDYDFGYDDKALFEKTYCYSAYEAFGVPPPHIRMCNLRMFAMEILDPTSIKGRL